jgi:hypothetical protein
MQESRQRLHGGRGAFEQCCNKSNAKLALQEPRRHRYGRCHHAAGKPCTRGGPDSTAFARDRKAAPGSRDHLQRCPTSSSHLLPHPVMGKFCDNHSLERENPTEFISSCAWQFASVLVDGDATHGATHEKGERISRAPGPRDFTSLDGHRMLGPKVDSASDRISCLGPRRCQRTSAQPDRLCRARRGLRACMASVSRAQVPFGIA